MKRKPSPMEQKMKDELDGTFWRYRPGLEIFEPVDVPVDYIPHHSSNYGGGLRPEPSSDCRTEVAELLAKGTGVMKIYRLIGRKFNITQEQLFRLVREVRTNG